MLHLTASSLEVHRLWIFDPANESDRLISAAYHQQISGFSPEYIQDLTLVYLIRQSSNYRNEMNKTCRNEVVRWPEKGGARLVGGFSVNLGANEHPHTHKANEPQAIDQ